MPDYKKLYYQLFAAMEDAIDAIENMNFGTAKEVLIQAQQAAEEAHLTIEEQ